MWDDIKGVESRRFIDERWVVSLEDFAKICGKTKRTVERWIPKGMPLHEKSTSKFNIVDVEYCLVWQGLNINKTKAKATKKKEVQVDIPSVPPNEDIEETVNDIHGKIRQANEMLQLKGTSHDDADRIKKILDGLIQAVKLGEQTKELIPKKDTEKVIVEFVATLIAGYKRDIKILPKELKQRDEEEIRQILESTYKTNIEKYQKIAKSDMLSEAKLYDVIEVVTQLILEDVSIDEILKGIKNK